MSHGARSDRRDSEFDPAVAMRTRAHLGTLSAADASTRTSSLSEAGARILRGTFMDAAGVLRAKQVQMERATVFHSPGLGASPV